MGNYITFLALEAAPWLVTLLGVLFLDTRVPAPIYFLYAYCYGG